MKLSEVLSFMDFKASVEYPTDAGVQELREELLKKDYIDETQINKPLVRLEDELGANLGDIDKERWAPDQEHLASSILDRMTSYIDDYIIDPLVDDLKECFPGEDITGLCLAQLWKKIKDRNFDLGEVGEVTEAIVNPDTIEVDITVKED